MRQRLMGTSREAGGAEEGEKAVGADSRKVDWSKGTS